MTLTDILKTLETADAWTWHRGDGIYSNGALDVYIDDIPKDMRTVYRVELPKSGPPHLETVILEDYDKRKHTWKTEVRRKRDSMETRKGEKALRDYIRSVCSARLGYQNPNIFTNYKKAPK